MSKSGLAKLKIGPKLIAAFLVIGIVPFAIIGLVALDRASEALSDQAFNQLEGVHGIKKVQIENFFAERKADMGVLMETVDTLRSEANSKLTAIREIKKIGRKTLLRQHSGSGSDPFGRPDDRRSHGWF